MAEFAHIKDPRHRAEARMNYMLRGKPVSEDAYIDSIVNGYGSENNRGFGFGDVERDAIARYFLDALEDEGFELVLKT